MMPIQPFYLIKKLNMWDAMHTLMEEEWRTYFPEKELKEIHSQVFSRNWNTNKKRKHFTHSVRNYYAKTIKNFRNEIDEFIENKDFESAYKQVQNVEYLIEAIKAYTWLMYFGDSVPPELIEKINDQKKLSAEVEDTTKTKVEQALEN